MSRTRRDHRVHVDIRVECEESASGARIFGRATDISLGGLRIETTGEGSFGAAVIVRLRLPGAVAPVSLDAIVRWTRPGSMGLQFRLLGARETHLIADLAHATARTLDANDVAWVGRGLAAGSSWCAPSTRAGQRVNAG